MKPALIINLIISTRRGKRPLLVEEIESGFDSVTQTAEDNCADGIEFHQVVREAQGHSSGWVEPLKLCRGKCQVQAADIVLKLSESPCAYDGNDGH